MRLYITKRGKREPQDGKEYCQKTYEGRWVGG